MRENAKGEAMWRTLCVIMLLAALMPAASVSAASEERKEVAMFEEDTIETSAGDL